MGFYTVWNDEPRIPVVANIPHASLVVPDDVRGQFLIDDVELRRQVELYADRHSDDVFRATHLSGAFAIRHDVSRFVVDPQRSDDDSQEVMAERGLGVIYSHGVDGQVIRRSLGDGERETLLNRFYRPYHARIADATARSLKSFGRCVILDCHSYRSTYHSFEPNRHAPRPDIVIGTDWHHTPHGLVSEIEKLVDRHGWSFGIDKPYSGTYIPLPYYGDGRLTAFMLMVNMRLYMNEQTNTVHDGLAAVRDLVADVVHLACEM